MPDPKTPDPEVGQKVGKMAQDAKNVLEKSAPAQAAKAADKAGKAIKTAPGEATKMVKDGLRSVFGGKKK